MAKALGIGESMIKKKVKKAVAAVLAVVLCVSGSGSALAASTSGLGVTEGGSAGKTTIYYTFNCKAYYTSTIDACLISMNSASGNLVEFIYGPMTTTRIGGLSVPTSTADTSSGTGMTYKNWTVATGYAGQNYASSVPYLKGGSTGTFGYTIMYDVAALY